MLLCYKALSNSKESEVITTLFLPSILVFAVSKKRVAVLRRHGEDTAGQDAGTAGGGALCNGGRHHIDTGRICGR